MWCPAFRADFSSLSTEQFVLSRKATPGQQPWLLGAAARSSCASAGCCAEQRAAAAPRGCCAAAGWWCPARGQHEQHEPFSPVWPRAGHAWHDVCRLWRLCDAGPRPAAAPRPPARRPSAPSRPAAGRSPAASRCAARHVELSLAEPGGACRQNGRSAAWGKRGGAGRGRSAAGGDGATQRMLAVLGAREFAPFWFTWFAWSAADHDDADQQPTDQQRPRTFTWKPSEKKEPGKKGQTHAQDDGKGRGRAGGDDCCTSKRAAGDNTTSSSWRACQSAAQSQQRRGQRERSRSSSSG